MVFLSSLFLLLALGAIAYPLMAPPRTRTGSEGGEAEELAQERESALAAIRDLEFEHSVGNLTDDDFAALRDQDTERAARVLARLDRLAMAAPTGDDSHQVESREIPDSLPAAAACAACGGAVGPDDRHCGACGAYLLEGAACRACDNPLDESDRYCSRCGRKVEAA